jgi:hypothetical protein
VGYQRTDLFGQKHLYVNLSMPFQYYFTPIDEQHWGATTVRKHQLVNKIWFFVGYTL